MSSLIQPILAELDPTIVMIVIAMFVVLLIITIIKKAIKFVIMTTVIIGVLILSIPAAKSFQENYNFEIKDNAAYIISQGQDYVIDDIGKIKSATFIYNGLNGVDVQIKYIDTNFSINLPSFMAESLQKFFDKYGIAYKIQ